MSLFINNIQNITFTILLLLSFFGVFLHKSISLKIMTFIFAYPAFHIYYLATGGEALRILASVGMEKYESYIPHAFYVYSTCQIIFNLILLSVRNETFKLYCYYRLSAISVTLLIIVLFLSSIISYPWLFGMTSRRVGLLPGNGWVSIFIGTYIVLTLSENAKSNVIKVFLFMLPLYFILRGERVNNILFVFLLLFIPSGQEKEITIGKYFKYIIPILIVGSLSYIAGNLRSGTSVDSFDAFFIFNYITAMESLHVYFSGIWLVDQNGFNLDPIINMIASIIPFSGLGGAGSPFFFEKIISSNIATVGGGIVITEGYLVMGTLGAILWTISLAYIIKWSFLSKKLYMQYLFIVMFALSFRVFWYGWEYIITPYYIGLLYFYFLFRLVGWKEMENKH